jgi:hypothetical protein
VWWLRRPLLFFLASGQCGSARAGSTGSGRISRGRGRAGAGGSADVGQIKRPLRRHLICGLLAAVEKY